MSGVFGVALPFGLWVAHVLVVAVPVTCLVALLFRVRLWLVPKEKRSVGVLVLGDLGRSPRMQYHCLSLLGHDRPVDTIAYGGSKPFKKLVAHPLLRMHSIAAPYAVPQGSPRVLFLLWAPCKVMFQVVQLLWLLLFRTRPLSHLLVQNPPSIPTLMVASVARLVTGCTFVIDWHNYGYSILALTLSPTHWLVSLSQSLELAFGQFSDENFCVTNAMKHDLAKNWHVTARTLHDRPPEHFRPLTIEQQHDLFCRLTEQYPKSFGSFENTKPLAAGETLFTRAGPTGGPELRSDRPALLVSSTSWTADEDFSILLSALELYEEKHQAQFPKLLCAITGKGPLKSHYEQLIAAKKFKHVRVCTLWLAAEDYPRLLGSATVGVSLHSSSSGIDLPMKVVDMFGSGLPVCALSFSCIGELVKHGSNGYLFTGSSELVMHLQRLLFEFPQQSAERNILAQMRQNLDAFRAEGWAPNWDKIAWPVFQK
eukprot:m.245761 g.245761  ORF g.245761 m.245761 type:complete len:482 (-) comp19054_c0_seq4:944-2389(-)